MQSVRRRFGSDHSRGPGSKRTIEDTLLRLKRHKSEFMKNFSWRCFRRVLVIVLLIVIVFQIFYPTDKTLPNSSIASTNYGWRSVDQAASYIQKKFDALSLKIVADDSTANVRLTDLGASIDADQLADQLNDYSWWQRLIPFSILFVGGSVDAIQPEINNDILNQSVSNLAKNLNSEAKNASISINDSNEIVVSAAKDKVVVKESDIQKSIKDSTFSIGSVNTVKVTAESEKPAVDNSAVQTVKTKLTDMSQIKLTITNSLTNAITTPKQKLTGMPGHGPPIQSHLGKRTLPIKGVQQRSQVDARTRDNTDRGVGSRWRHPHGHATGKKRRWYRCKAY